MFNLYLKALPDHKFKNVDVSSLKELKFKLQ